MAKRWLWAGILCVTMLGCGGPDLCDCEQEAKKENPDVDTMKACEDLYEGKDYEEIEAALLECK